MIKKFKDFINESKDIDPFEEEDWDDEEFEDKKYSDIDPFGNEEYRKSLIGKRIIYKKKKGLVNQGEGSIDKIKNENFANLFHFLIGVNWDNKKIYHSDYYNPSLLKIINTNEYQ